MSHFVTHPGTPSKNTSHISDPTSIFTRPSTKTRIEAHCTNSLSIVREGFLPGGFCRGVFCMEGFVQGGFCPFPLLSEYIYYNRNLNITLNFMFHMYNKKFISVTSHALDPPPGNKLSHLLGTLPLEREVLYERPLVRKNQNSITIHGAEFPILNFCMNL